MRFCVKKGYTERAESVIKSACRCSLTWQRNCTKETFLRSRTIISHSPTVLSGGSAKKDMNGPRGSRTELKATAAPIATAIS